MSKRSTLIYSLYFLHVSTVRKAARPAELFKTMSCCCPGQGYTDTSALIVLSHNDRGFNALIVKEETFHFVATLNFAYGPLGPGQ